MIGLLLALLCVAAPASAQMQTTPRGPQGSAQSVPVVIARDQPALPTIEQVAPVIQPPVLPAAPMNPLLSRAAMQRYCLYVLCAPPRGGIR